MSTFLVGVGCAASFDGVEYQANDLGVISIPDALDLVAVNVQGLSRYVEAPAAEVVATAAPAEVTPVAARGPGRPRKADTEAATADPVAAEVVAEVPAE